MSSTSNKTLTLSGQSDSEPVALYKAVYSVAELAERWQVHSESIRRLIRDKKIKTLSGFRPYRITFDEVRRYECLDEASEIRVEYMARRKKGGRK